ncbi:MAG: hypothetical protein AB7D20_08180 [Sulfuricurvum sp.]|uniref:hypothetical protein n=1 Tax=Sulfuricurvum sp. TaxID=2025608 RepID=UPI003D112C2E
MPRINADSNITVEYNYDPDVCPQCHHALHPKILQGTLNGDVSKRDTLLEIAFKCTHRNCMSMFIGQYKRSQMESRTGTMVGDFKHIKSVPLKYIAPTIFPEVENISPSFKIIYEQAHAAEANQLDEIAGVGFRKALEYLIKDYCIYKNPDNEQVIKSTMLGAVIQNYVDDGNLKACAQRAAWLGNDETHYIRKWENKDINDLKTLIDLSCVWVKSNILTEKYLHEMNNT